MIKTVGVIGAGTMGNGIAQVFAQSGFSVLLVDIAKPMLERARASIEKSLARFVEKGKLPAADRDATLGRLTITTAIDRLTEADFIVEAIVEQAEAKGTLFTSLDAIVRPEVIFASNTSSISITVIGAATKRPDKVLGMHFMNPVPLMPLVELIRGQRTSVESMRHGVRSWPSPSGKTPIEAADYPGFIANRILMPMINEAIYALMEGVGTAEAIDSVMKLGMNHPMGPLTLADFIGLDVCLAILNVLHDGLRRSEVPAVSATAPDGRGGTARAQIGPGLLHVLTTASGRSGRGSPTPAPSPEGSARTPATSASGCASSAGRDRVRRYTSRNRTARTPAGPAADRDRRQANRGTGARRTRRRT
jgi:3-hydroxybutyryl-CoA dehydrogenase